MQRFMKTIFLEILKKNIVRDAMGIHVLLLVPKILYWFNRNAAEIMCPLWAVYFGILYRYAFEDLKEHLWLKIMTDLPRVGTR